MAYCPKCGNELNTKDSFCGGCGTKVDANISQDSTLKADIKVEMTNATTEKVFAKVGETIDDSKKTIQSSFSFLKRIFIPVIIALSLGYIVSYFFAYKMYERDMRAQAKEGKRFELEMKAYKQQIFVGESLEKWHCVRDNIGINWDEIDYECSLNHRESKLYKKNYNDSVYLTWGTSPSKPSFLGLN